MGTPPDQIGAQLLAQQHPALAQRHDVAFGFQPLHHPRDHLARGADHLGNLLARQAGTDHPLLAHLLRHVEQHAGHTAIHVEQGQRLDLPVGLAQAAHQAGHDAQAHLGAGHHHGLEAFLVDRHEVAGIDGDHAGRTRRLVDQAHLAEALARADHGQNHFLALGIRTLHLGTPRQQDVQGLRRLPFRDDDPSLGKIATDAACRQPLDLRFGQTGKQRHAPQECDVLLL